MYSTTRSRQGGKPNFIRVSSADRCASCGRSRGCTYRFIHGKKEIYCVTNRDTPRRASDGRGIIVTDANGVTAPLEPKRPEAAVIGRRHAVYTEMLRRLTLSDEDYQGLKTRGLTDAEIEKLEYKSAADIAEELSDAGYILDRVPGFYQENGEWRMNIRPGFFVPVRDTLGRIQGLQMRTRGDKSRYLWFSSYCKVLPNGDKELLPAGASSGCPISHRKGSQTAQSVWITEGILKADVLWLRTGYNVIGKPGVTGKAGETIREIDVSAATFDYDCAILAYDMDWQKNPAVRRAMIQQADAIKARSGAEVKLAVWPGEYKGIDDALLAGVTKFVIAPFSQETLARVG